MEGREPVNVDAEPLNADWIKTRTWDVWTRDGGGLVRTLDQLRERFDHDDDRLAHFMTLPSAMPMPEALRAEVKAHFRTPRWVPSEALYRALAFAVELHAYQPRKNPTRDPYLVHLLSVAALVVEDGGGESDAIGALLHDAVEDHPIRSEGSRDGRVKRLEQIRADFGEAVARIVDGCTDTLEDPKPAWRPRKEAYLARLPTESADVRRVALCDKLHNLRCVVADLEQGRGFGLFNADAADQAWYYDELRKAFDESGTASRHLAEFKTLAVGLGKTLARRTP